MSDQSNLCYIIDYQRSYYRLDNNNQLVVAGNKEEASVFSTADANAKIGEGRKAQFYSIVPVDEEQGLSSDLKDIQWVEYLQQFCALTVALEKYQTDLNDALSDVDMKICDIMHYVELYDVQGQCEELVERLRECRDERRKIKDEMFCADTFQRAIGTKENVAKAKEALKQIRKLDTRKYAPRKLSDLFVDGVKRQDAEVRTWPVQNDVIDYAEAVADVREEVAMERVRRETVFDGRDNDWREFARQQVEFYSNINQYITNQYIRMDELDARIEELLELTEEANYNAVQGYKVFKMLKECRNERKAIMTELEYLEPMAACFDCRAMQEAYQYSLNVMEEVMAQPRRNKEYPSALSDES